MIRRLLGSLVPHRLKLAARNFFLRGDGVYCPLCESRFVTFLPFGGTPRANAICPKCGSLERTRLYWLYLNAKQDFFSRKMRLLHVAPERKLFERFSSFKTIEYFPVDKFAEGYTYPKGTVKMDVTDLKFDNDYFDFILCSHVLEHVPDDRKALSEFFRVLKRGGEGILQVPLDTGRQVTLEDPSITDPVIRKEKFGETDHLRAYGLDYKERLEGAGFEVTTESFGIDLDIYSRFRFGIVPEHLYVVSKPG